MYLNIPTNRFILDSRMSNYNDKDVNSIPDFYPNRFSDDINVLSVSENRA